MAWTTPQSFPPGTYVTQAIAEAHWKDNPQYLKDRVDVLIRSGLGFLWSPESVSSIKSVDAVFGNTGATATAYTVPASTTTLVQKITIVNHAGATRVARLYLTTGSSGASSTVFLSISLEAGESMVLDTPILMASSEKLLAYCPTDNASISVRAEVVEFASVPSGYTLKTISVAAPGASSWTSLYTPGVGVSKAILIGVVGCNYSTATAAYLNLGSGGATPVNYILDGTQTLGADETVAIDGPMVLDSGDALSAWVNAATVNFRVSVIEVS